MKNERITRPIPKALDSDARWRGDAKRVTEVRMTNRGSRLGCYDSMDYQTTGSQSERKQPCEGPHGVQKRTQSPAKEFPRFS